MSDSADRRRRRDAFFRYYTIPDRVNFSLGSHDEYNLWQELNRRRREAPAGIADQIAGFFDGRQLDPSAMSAPTAPGYALEESPKAPCARPAPLLGQAPRTG